MKKTLFEEMLEIYNNETDPEKKALLKRIVVDMLEQDHPGGLEE